MFNTGTIWRGHLAATRDQLLACLPAAPTVVEVGCGEGHFLRGLATAGGTEGMGRFAGFDPHASGESGRGVEFHPRYFMPLTDLSDFAPDAVVMRHVLEHLTDPDKVGSYVPGCGQEIQSRAVLQAVPAAVLIIPTQWRARDILAEMAQAGIEVGHVLIEHDGRLVDFFTEAHPY